MSRGKETRVAGWSLLLDGQLSMCVRRQKEGATIKPGNLQIYDALINGALWDNRGVLSTASKSIVLLAVAILYSEKRITIN